MCDLIKTGFKKSKKVMWTVISTDKLSGRIARTVHYSFVMLSSYFSNIFTVEFF